MVEIWKVKIRDNYGSFWDSHNVVATCAPDAIKKVQKLRKRSGESYYQNRNILEVELLAEA